MESQCLVANQNIDDEWMTNAYEDFKDRLTTKYLICNKLIQFDEFQKVLNMKEGNLTKFQVETMKCIACLFYPLTGPCFQIKTVFYVPNRHFAFVTNEESNVKKTLIYGPGNHVIGYYNNLQGIYSLEYLSENNFIDSTIGDIKLIQVKQGTIVHFVFGGQNIIIGPGIHFIQEPIMFKQIVSLDNFFIEIGPEKWVTIPDGYDGISINRGKLKILEGGKQHHLCHVSDKFVKIVPKTLLTDRVPTDIPQYLKNQNNNIQPKNNDNDLCEFLHCSTADGSNIIIDTMIFWRITNTDLAAKTAMEILILDTQASFDENQIFIQAQNNIQNLRQTVLRMVKHHLTALIGKCSLSGKINLDDDYDIQQVKSQIIVPQTVILYFFYNRYMVQSYTLQELYNYHSFNFHQLLRLFFSERTNVFRQLSNFFAIKQIPECFSNFESIPVNIIIRVSALCIKNLSSSGKQIQTKNFQNGKNNLNQENQQRNSFDILNILQSSIQSIKDKINYDLSTIGTHLDNICVYKVIPAENIQIEIDKQARVRLDGNTMQIQISNKKNFTELNQKIENEIAIFKAKSNADVILLKANSKADCQLITSNAEAQGIRNISDARKFEADVIGESEFSLELARLRVCGEVGEQVFQGKNNQFVFGYHPGNVIQEMTAKLMK